MGPRDYENILVLFLTKDNIDLSVGYGIPHGFAVDKIGMKGLEIDFSFHRSLKKHGKKIIKTTLVMTSEHFMELNVIPFGGNILSAELLPLLDSGHVRREGFLPRK